MLELSHYGNSPTAHIANDDDYGDDSIHHWIIIIVIEAMIILAVTLRFTTRMLQLRAYASVLMMIMKTCWGWYRHKDDEYDSDYDGEEEEEYGRSTVGPSMKVLHDVVYLASSSLSSKTPSCWQWWWWQGSMIWPQRAFLKTQTILVPKVQFPEEIADIQKISRIRIQNHLIGTQRYTKVGIHRGIQRYAAYTQRSGMVCTNTHMADTQRWGMPWHTQRGHLWHGIHTEVRYAMAYTERWGMQDNWWRHHVRPTGIRHVPKYFHCAPSRHRGGSIQVGMVGGWEGIMFLVGMKLGIGGWKYWFFKLATWVEMLILRFFS